MSSHTRNMARALREFEEIKKVIKANAKDPYTKGLYNGIELARFLMTDKAGSYYDKINTAYLEINKGTENGKD